MLSEKTCPGAHPSGVRRVLGLFIFDGGAFQGMGGVPEQIRPLLIDLPCGESPGRTARQSCRDLALPDSTRLRALPAIALRPLSRVHIHMQVAILETSPRMIPPMDTRCPPDTVRRHAGSNIFLTTLLRDSWIRSLCNLGS